MKSGNFKIALALLFFSTFFMACKREEEIIDGNAKFRLVNAFQGAMPQDFYQGDTKISTTAVAYGEVSDYLTVKAGASTVTFKSANTQDVSASGSIGINNDIS